MRAHTDAQKGFSVIEALVGASLVVIALVGVGAGFQLLVRLSLGETTELKAAYMLEEGAEAMRSIRDTNWETFSALSLDIPRYLLWSSGSWTTTTTPSVEGGLYRTVVLSSAYRDGAGDIAESGILEPDARHITVSVAWNERGATTTKSVEAYLFNIFE